MSIQALIDATIWLDAYDVSGILNSVDHEEKYAELVSTTFASGGNVERIAGLADFVVKVDGFWDTDVQPDLDTLSGVAGKVITVTPNGTAGDVALFGKGLVSGFKRGGKVGDIAPISGQVAASNADGLLHGSLLAAKRTESTSGNGSAVQVGAALSTQSLYAVLHVFEASGTLPTLDVTIESDSSGVFGSPTTQVTFAQATAAGCTYVTPVAGPVTDTYWRAAWTIGGTLPSFTFGVAFAIA